MAAVQEAGGVVADKEKPNWIAALAGETCALTPIDPLPCVYGPLGKRFQVMDVAGVEAASVTAVTVADTGPLPEAFTPMTEKS